MKFYLASSFSLITKVRFYSDVLESEGHEVTVKWWERLALKKKFQVLSPDDFYAEPECKYAFERDLEGIKEADALLFVAANEARSYNGANVEVGMAFGLGKPVFSLGILTNSAMYWGVDRCVTIREVLEKASIYCADLRRENPWIKRWELVTEMERRVNPA